MRRIARIQRPSAALTQCLHASASAPQHTAVVGRAAPAAARRTRDFTTTPQRQFHSSGRLADKTGPGEENAAEKDAEEAAKKKDARAWREKRRAAAEEDATTPTTTTTTGDAQQQEQQTPQEASAAAEQLLESYDPEAEAAAAEEAVETDLVLPPADVAVAPREDELEADGVRYEPAGSARGLEVVGGLGGWFQRDEHWGASKRYAGFAPSRRVDDASLLELNVRRAVAEALAVAAAGAGAGAGAGNSEAPLSLTGLWERGGREEAERALGLRLEVRADGAVGVVAAEAEGVARALRWDPDAPGAAAAGPGEEVGAQQFSAEEAREIVQSWDKGWKDISLHDVQLKFAVTKRILQLTGHAVPDSKLLSVHTAGQLVALLVKPEPPTRVAEALEQQGRLAGLANVRVHATRRTPVHKHQEVGRWKVIVEELERRKMPATGDGGIGRFVEDKWLRGPRLPKNERKKRR
ncbi:hypothetical protein KVR01_000158 [Diaporthe batatas]|uniref:uncharacterized protein n=1 Tax=Diaporthe batatas TaxID=748121 RepID=UPI001D037A7C|nr:uncharacterized protein KVR01_000158 [Diaporthe batatas]KAG8169413.1 hypothetical protein KVR01_000158 [Diaporthe batatas]